MNTIIKTTFYSGPLEILLKWLLSREINPFNIKISVLSEEFLNYYLKNEILSFKESIEFLYALTFFLLLKTKALFDKELEEEEGEEHKEESKDTVSLIEITQFLYERYERMRRIYTREEEEKSFDYGEDVLDPSILFAIFHKLIQKIPEVKEKLPEIPRIEEKIKLILNLLKKETEIYFSKLILKSKNKIEALVTFLAILELVRIRKIKCIQTRNFDDIIISTI